MPCRNLYLCFQQKFIFNLLINPDSSNGKESTCNAGDPDSIPGSKDPLERETVTHSRIITWNILRTRKPGGIQSVELQRGGHD